MSSTGVSRIEGIDPSVAIKAPCQTVTTANITLSGSQTVGGLLVQETTPKTRVLVNNQTNPVLNGIYDVYDTAWQRSDDFNGSRDAVEGTLVSVVSGDFANTLWKLTTANPVIIGTSAIVFSTTDEIGLPNVETVATFAALASTPMTVGQIVTTAGHTTAGIGSLSFIGKSGSVTNNGGTQINSATVGVYAKAVGYRYLGADIFGAIADGSDETAFVQSALDAMADTEDYLLIISDGVKFNLSTLTFPERCNIEYRVDDDLSAPNPSGDIGSGERVYFSSNSSYPTDPTGAVVNEWRFTAPFHPGICVDVRKSVSGGDSYLAPGQSRTNPARVSANMYDDQEGNWSKSVELYDTYSNFSGVKEFAYRRIYTLNGIGTAQWASVPVFGTLITGTTSGAKGFLVSVSAGATTVLWYSGKFVTGETVSDNNETTVATISSAVYTTTQMQTLSTGMLRGNWAVGLPPESSARRPLLGVGGMIGVQQTRTFGQYVDETIDHPGYELVDSYESSPPNGFQIIYDTTAAAAARRITLRKYQTSADIGLVGATGAATGFTDAVLKADSSFNVASVVKNSTGDYTINFTTAFARADYMVSFGTSAALDYAYTFTKTTSALRVRVVDTGTTTLKNLTGVLDVVCHCGDI